MADATGAYEPRPDDDWGPATPVRSTSAGSRREPPPSARRSQVRPADGWSDVRSSGGSRQEPGRADSAVSSYRSAPAPPPRGSPGAAHGSAWDRLAGVGDPDSAGVPERGLAGWAALLVLVGIAGIGGLIDMLSGTHVRGGFNVGIVIASVVAIVLVRRSAMFPVVVAPPIVYSLASGLMLYVRSNGLNDRRVLIDSAANWLVYGFPAVAAATAAVLIIAGVRMITRR